MTAFLYILGFDGDGAKHHGLSGNAVFVGDGEVAVGKAGGVIVNRDQVGIAAGSHIHHAAHNILCWPRTILLNSTEMDGNCQQ